jgi:hypothetical protein
VDFGFNRYSIVKRKFIFGYAGKVYISPGQAEAITLTRDFN